MDDFILAQSAENNDDESSNPAYQKLLKVKGPAEVYER